MKNKNVGFTLVELLATILILGILALISIPVVNGIITASRDKAYLETVKTIERAAERYYMDKEDLEDGNKVTIQNLLDKGYIRSVSNDIPRNSYVLCEDLLESGGIQCSFVNTN